MKFVEIKNWKDLKDQFGLKKVNSCKTAIEIGKELTKLVNNSKDILTHVTVDCNENSEAICLFEYSHIENNKYFYIYRGTAN